MVMGIVAILCLTDIVFETFLLTAFLRFT